MPEGPAEGQNNPQTFGGAPQCLNRPPPDPHQLEVLSAPASLVKRSNLPSELKDSVFNDSFLLKHLL